MTTTRRRKPQRVCYVTATRIPGWYDTIEGTIVRRERDGSALVRDDNGDEAWHVIEDLILLPDEDDA